MNTNNLPNDSRDIAPEPITQLLTQASLRLDDRIVAALHHIHDIALEKQSQSEPVFALGAGHPMHWPKPSSAYQWLAMIILLLAILFGGAGYWQHAQETELSHLDAAILTDDLPLEIFVD